MAILDILVSTILSSCLYIQFSQLFSCFSLLTASHQGSLHLICRFVHLKVAEDKSKISPMLVTVSKATSRMFDGVIHLSVYTERPGCQLLLALARVRVTRSLSWMGGRYKREGRGEVARQLPVLTLILLLQSSDEEPLKASHHSSSLGRKQVRNRDAHCAKEPQQLCIKD